MKELVKKTVLGFAMVFIFAITFSSINTVNAEEGSLQEYYELDSVYSTYSSSTNYTLAGGMYSNRDGLAVRTITSSSAQVGVTLPFVQTIEVTADSAIVLDVLFYTNLTRTMKLEVVESDTTISSMVNTLDAYTAKDNEVVQTLEIGNNAFNNNLHPSSGFDTKNINLAYNQLVVPLTSFGFSVGETISIASLNFYAPSWSTGLYHKYLLMSAGVSDDFSSVSPFTTTSIWNAGVDSYAGYGDTATYLDIRFLPAGKLLMEPSVNSSSNGVIQELVFKFPDELINENGYVSTANLAGLTLEFLNETATSFNGHFKLYSTTGSAIANSNYSNLKTHKITRDGVEADSNAKYFYPNTNTVGYADAIIGYNFNSTNNVTTSSTESFYCADGALPTEISPFITFSYDTFNTFS